MIKMSEVFLQMLFKVFIGAEYLLVYLYWFWPFNIWSILFLSLYFCCFSRMKMRTMRATTHTPQQNRATAWSRFCTRLQSFKVLKVALLTVRQTGPMISPERLTITIPETIKAQTMAAVDKSLKSCPVYYPRFWKIAVLEILPRGW